MSVSPRKVKSKPSFIPCNTLNTPSPVKQPLKQLTSSSRFSLESIGSTISLFDSSLAMDDQQNLSQASQTSKTSTSSQTVPKKDPLRAKLNIFNIPKKGIARPEHHRAVPKPGDSSTNTGTSNPPSRSASGSTSTSTTSATSISNAYIIPPPLPLYDAANRKYIIPAADKQNTDRPMFSSFGTPFDAPQSIPHSGVGRMGQMGGLIDLTKDAYGGFDPNAALKGRQDAYEYVDPVKANENLKKLLEGAFDEDDDVDDDDDDDKAPGADGAKKKQKKKNIVFPKSLKKKTISPSQNSGGSKSLTERLKNLDVSNDETKKATEKKETDHEDENEDEEEEGVIEGLKVKLLPHQIEGVSWMIERESGKKKRGILPKGGILADDMGLGKTIQAISLILLNPRPSDETIEKIKEKKRKIPTSTSHCTLVVAPLALIKQWESEIKTKAPELTVLVHHGPSRTTNVTKMKNHDVVITTYQTIMSDVSAAKGSVPFQIQWYRVILDEAHSIKNPSAKSTQACYQLQSIYRWCLTGTPLQNNYEELQSLIRFLRIDPYREMSAFKRDIIAPIKNGRGHIGIRRLHYFLAAFMKRRTKDVLKKEGAFGNGEGETAGFKIVERKVEQVMLEFDERERTFYSRLESRAAESLDKMIQKNKNDYLGAFVLLLRLRQACNHAYLMGAKLDKDQDAMSLNANNTRPQQDQSQNQDVDGLADLMGGLSVEVKNCDMCKKRLSQVEVTDGQSRCGECVSDLQITLGAPLRDQETKTKTTKKKHQKSKQDDHEKLRQARNRRMIVDSDDEDENEWIVPKKKQTVKDGELDTDDENVEGGGDWIGDEDSETDEEEDSQDLENEDEEQKEQEKKLNPYKLSFRPDHSSTTIPPSSKITALLNILATETPEHKVIVFSQFTTMLDVIQPFLEAEGLRYVRYDGSMKNDQREESLRLLRENKKTRVLLCSLKCGSLGLNLTAASRVVIMEPFWNPFVEEQAIDRVHRLNQTRDVTVYKLTIAETVEANILKLQEAKRAMAASALESGKGAAKLNMQDILALFKGTDEMGLDPMRRDFM